MSRIIEAVERHARTAPQRIVIEDGTRSLTYAQLWREVDALARRLRRTVPPGCAVALLADNGSAWALADLAALHAGIPIVPLPPFFSPAQLVHALRSSGAGCVLTDHPERVTRALGIAAPPEEFGAGLSAIRSGTAADAADLGARTWKVTFTSGTTGEPKGVCLAVDDLERTAQSLCAATDAEPDDRHLCVLPLATLLENLGGIYVPLLAGATICAPPMSALGMSGSSSLDVRRFVAALHGWLPTSAIMVPQMLQALVAAVRAGTRPPRSLRYLAIGGAPVSTAVLRAAIEAGLPVHEGYGLSECGSVVAVNRPGAARLGSVGKPLPHLEVTIAEDGEIHVGGVAWSGYLGGQADAPSRHPIATGDLGFFDADGFLHLTGRRRRRVHHFVRPQRRPRMGGARAGSRTADRPGRRIRRGAAVQYRGDRRRTIGGRACYPGRARCSPTASFPTMRARTPGCARRLPFSADNGLSTPNGRLHRDAIFARLRRPDRCDLQPPATGVQ